MSKTIYDIFISYSSKDQKVAEGICAYLEQRHFRCFVAYRDIPKAKVWASAIVEALDESRMMVVVFSKNFNVSEQVDREIELAAEDHKPILTFRLSSDAFQGAKKYYLKNINWIDAFPEPDKCFGELAEEVEKLLGSPTVVVSAKRENTDKKSINNTQLSCLKLKADIDCIFYLDGEERSHLRAGVIQKIPLARGEYELMFISEENGNDRLELEFLMPDVDKLQKVSLCDIRAARLNKEAEAKRIAEEKRLDEERKREAERKTEEKRRAEEERKRQEEEARRKAELAAKRKAEKERRKAEQEKRRAEEIAKQKAEEEARRKEEEEARQNEEAVNLLETIKELNANGKHEAALKLLMQEEANAPERYKPYFYYHIGNTLVAIGKSEHNSDKRNEAIKWWEKAAELGHVESQLRLGTCYLVGLIVSTDAEKAKAYYLQSGTAEGYYSVGAMYRAGNGMVKDYDLAKYFFEIAAERGSIDALYGLGYIFYNGGYGLEEDLSKAFEYFKKAAEKGSSEGAYKLAYCYYNEKGTKKDYNKAFKWYSKAVELKHPQAYNALGNMYYRGEGVTKNYVKAFELYQEAAKRNQGWGMSNLASMYFDAEGVERNFSEAKKWYQKAVEKGIEKAKEKVQWIEEWENLCEKHGGLYKIGKLNSGVYIYDPKETYYRNDTCRYGFADKTGKELVKCEWNWAGEFINERALVWNEKNKLGIIDKSGTIIMPCTKKYEEAIIIDGSYVRAFEGAFYELYDLKTGKAIVDTVTYTKMGEKFIDGYLYVEKFRLFGKDKKGKIDREGHFIEDK